MHTWRGIPYARAVRFGAPSLVEYDPARPATEFGPAAPQPHDGPLGELVPGMRVGETAEDGCLTLNIWAPSVEGAAAAARPVLVWFHGGSFVIGSAAQAVYDGARLAEEQQVVVVSVNYRLGALGFLDTRPIGGVANAGVCDALCALQWVHDHIAAFGGDPTRVVPFGESAGGGLLLHALTAPTARSLVAGAIIQSGATFATLDDERATVVVETLVKEAAVDDLAALRALPVGELVGAQSRALGTLLPTVGMMPFHPMIDGDVVTRRPADGLAFDGPLLLGTTADEMALFVDRNAPAPPRDRLVRRVARYLGRGEHGAAAVIDAYGVALDTEDAAAIWRAIFGDREMQVPARAVLDAHPRSFTYCFTWAGPEVGACHGIDIPFPFGNFVDGWDAFTGLDADGRRLSQFIQRAWAEFARSGNPGWSAHPAAMILGREQYLVPAHPLFSRAGF